MFCFVSFVEKSTFSANNPHLFNQILLLHTSPINFFTSSLVSTAILTRYCVAWEATRHFTNSCAHQLGSKTQNNNPTRQSSSLYSWNSLDRFVSLLLLLAKQNSHRYPLGLAWAVGCFCFTNNNRRTSYQYNSIDKAKPCHPVGRSGMLLGGSKSLSTPLQRRSTLR